MLTNVIAIDHLITMYYFEFAKDYVFEGERHDFWEMVYTDKGEITVTTDETTTVLSSGHLIFHKPNEFHSFCASRGTAPDVIVLTFDCRSPAMLAFENRVFRLNDDERNLLAGVLREGRSCFQFPFEMPLRRREDAPADGEQMLRVHLELLLLQLLRRVGDAVDAGKLLTPAQARDGQELVERTIAYMERNLERSLTLDEIGSAVRMTKSRLKEQFKRGTGHSVMNYFVRLRIDRAKSLIRESGANFSEIADRLGFSSVHVFTRSFKKTTGMTPTEYAKSVRARW